jgi:hypothetical protein
MYFIGSSQLFNMYFLTASLLFTIASAKTQLSNGNSMQYGVASAILNWQSSGTFAPHGLLLNGHSDHFILSGILYRGCDNVHEISDCYTLSLTSDPTKQLDPGPFPSPRQRIEFRSPDHADGTTYMYTWNHKLSSSVGTTASFFHLMQVFSTGNAGPVVTLDAVSGRLAINDFSPLRACTLVPCPSIPISSILGVITSHTMVVTYGPAGKLYYVVKDLSGNKLLSYNVTGAMGFGGT